MINWKISGSMWATGWGGGGVAGEPHLSGEACVYGLVPLVQAADSVSQDGQKADPWESLGRKTFLGKHSDTGGRTSQSTAGE